jgi:hypothetical protein
MHPESGPDFLCIGAQKAGTTWLMSNLSAHPAVWTPRFAKELHYFDCLHLGSGKDWVLRSYTRRGLGWCGENPRRTAYFRQILDPQFAFTDEWYRHIFSIAPKDRVRGECTPLYCALGEEGVRHVMRLSPGLKLIYMIRDPFDRMMSSLRMTMQRGGIADSAAVEGLLEDRIFQARGDYARNIPLWESMFGPRSILYVPFSKIRSAPESVMRLVEDHLGIGRFDGYPRLRQVVHPTDKAGLRISDRAVARIREIVAPQYPFLREKFGNDFTVSPG